jgi:hypothetical protein
MHTRARAGTAGAGTGSAGRLLLRGLAAGKRSGGSSRGRAWFLAAEEAQRAGRAGGLTAGEAQWGGRGGHLVAHDAERAQVLQHAQAAAPEHRQDVVRVPARARARVRDRVM